MFKHFIFLVLSALFFVPLNFTYASEVCEKALLSKKESFLAPRPRLLDPGQTFDSIVKWIHDDLIVKRKAPGFVVGLSGTDSILVFLAAAKAFENAGRPDRVVGIHYGELTEDPVQAEVLPWLQSKAPGATVRVDSSIDSKREGMRWGALMDWSVVADTTTGAMRAPQDRYWVLGTRNASEEYLGTYSNISKSASVQVIPHLWKSEVLALCAYLGVPKVALQKSCLADCVCGRRELPALHIPEVDALIMERLGILSPQYIANTITPRLKEQLDAFIDEQESSAAFKQVIPYRPEDSAFVVSAEEEPDDFKLAKRIAEQGASDTRPIARVIPYMIKNHRADLVSDLMMGLTPRLDLFLPEALMLFNTPGLRSNQKLLMAEKIFSIPNVSLADSRAIARVSAGLANYGFSFPQWRFLTQKYLDSKNRQHTLAEEFKMTRLHRITDIQNPHHSPEVPTTDFWGAGFIWHDLEWYIEFRRAYILISHLSDSEPTTALIRNNSYFFGRDRLKEPTYISWEKLSAHDLMLLTDRDVQSRRFIPYQKVFSRDFGEIKQNAQRIEKLLTRLDTFNREFDTWLKDTSSLGGFQKLLDFLKYKLWEKPNQARPPLWLAFVEGSSLSWYPEKVAALTEETLAELRKPGSLKGFLDSDKEGSRLVLMSGENGDYP